MPFKKGQSGNPKGGPKKQETMTHVLRMAVETDVMLPDGRKVKAKEALAYKIIELAASGEGWAMKYIYDRLDGSPKQVIEAKVEKSEKEVDLSELPPETVPSLIDAVSRAMDTTDEADS